MRRRTRNTETGWFIAKSVVVIAVLGTLSGFTVLSHLMSRARVGRIDCIDNQRATYQALLVHQADSDGRSPRTLDLLKNDPRNLTVFLGRCPMDDTVRYRIDVGSGRVFCPNPAHRIGS